MFEKYYGYETPFSLTCMKVPGRAIAITPVSAAALLKKVFGQSFYKTISLEHVDGSS